MGAVSDLAEATLFRISLKYVGAVSGSGNPGPLVNLLLSSKTALFHLGGEP